MRVEIFSDGACSGNPGVGGYGSILRCGDKEKELSGAEELTTNNRMELMGAIAALEALKKPCDVVLTTDSQYLYKGMTQWLSGWVRKGWVNSRKEAVLNRDLWERLLELSKVHKITWVWVRGHNGHAENERCDALARAAIDECRKRMGD